MFPGLWLGTSHSYLTRNTHVSSATFESFRFASQPLCHTASWLFLFFFMSFDPAQFLDLSVSYCNIVLTRITYQWRVYELHLRASSGKCLITGRSTASHVSSSAEACYKSLINITSAIHKENSRVFSYQRISILI